MHSSLIFRRACIAFCSLLIICSVLIIRLFFLGMYNTKSKEVLSGQYSRTQVVSERNGLVYGSDGKLLSHTCEKAVAIINPAIIYDKNTALQYISSHSQLSYDEIIGKLSVPKPFTVTFSEYPDTASPEGIYVYPLYEEAENYFCRHLLGYRDTEGNGIDGIYAKFSGILDAGKGSLSFSYAADAAGNLLEDESLCIKNEGYTRKSGIILTINSQLQNRVDNICSDYMDMGAVIVSNLSDGNILALSSRPLYDMNNIADSLDSGNGELINRVFSLYTPGSVFKTVTAAAALECDKEYINFSYECTGSCDVSGKIFNCHEKDGHGIQDMKSAYANSCNTYFIKLCEAAGFENVLLTAEKMGLGKPYAIDGIYVKAANIPDITKKYPPAYKANFSFGQGDTLLTPIDILNIFSICTTGTRRDFSIIKGIYDGENDTVDYFSPNSGEKILSTETTQLLLEMMKECVVSGTGILASNEKVSTGGKTATAQSGQFSNGKEILHRIFAGVFPIENPEYAVVVLCDGNGKSNTSPAKIFSLVAEAATEVSMEE